MFAEDDLLPISALQHLAFCERQWGLIHLERIWDENRLTTEGRHLHNRADSSVTETRGNVRIVRGLRLRSLRLGLSGKADVVEFHRLKESDCDSEGQGGMCLEGISGLWHPVPVEYKRGRPKHGICDEVQLCAQSICMEEMMSVNVTRGMLFYGMPRRRYDVLFDETLRGKTEALTERLHELMSFGKTPDASYSKKCKSCSLENQCMPKTVGRRKKVERYLHATVSDCVKAEVEQ